MRFQITSVCRKENKIWKPLIDKNQLVCLENISTEKLINLYRISDFLFLPSRDEGFGFPIIEALCLGTPLLIIHPKAASIVDSNCYFILQSTTNFKDLYDYLQNWVNFAPKISEKIRTKFSLNLIKSKYREQILDLLNY